MERIIVQCDCGCAEIHIEAIDYDLDVIEEYAISFYINAFLSEQQQFKKIMKRLEIAWKILTKGIYRYQEIILDQETLDDLKMKINKF